jgi:hypothetical protein
MNHRSSTGVIASPIAGAIPRKFYIARCLLCNTRIAVATVRGKLHILELENDQPNWRSLHTCSSPAPESER